MATQAEKIAQSLEFLKKFQNKKGVAVIRSKDLSRSHRERLLQQGFLQEVIKGWYISVSPDSRKGDTTAWYTSFWYFCSEYLNSRFSIGWCLSPEMSLMIHTGNWTVPQQLLVRSPKGNNNITQLLFGTSIFDARLEIPDDSNIVIKNGVRICSLPIALITCSPTFFSQNPTEARVTLAMIRDASEILRQLLQGGHTRIAGRLAGAFRNIVRERIANDIVITMKSAGHDVRENDPFIDSLGQELSTKIKSPYVNRLRLMWEGMRNEVLKHFPEPPGRTTDIKAYMKTVQDIYITDAYHSLSIEGYRVSPELIEKVRSGQWDPDSEEDRKHRDAMAARGYWQAHQAVHASLERVLSNEKPGKVWDEDHCSWYLELFAPSVAAGLSQQSDLAGYRNDQVYISQSRHVPMSHEAVLDVMPVLSKLFENEPETSVRVVLGHFIFVYIHPYMDGNGRMARFLMNLMLASGGYPWTVIPVEKRDEYIQSLESASVDQNIEPFARFIASLVQKELAR